MPHLKIDEFLLYAGKPNTKQADDLNSMQSTTIISTIGDTGQDHHNKVKHRVKHIKIVANTSKPTAKMLRLTTVLLKSKIHKQNIFFKIVLVYSYRLPLHQTLKPNREIQAPAHSNQLPTIEDNWAWFQKPDHSISSPTSGSYQSHPQPFQTLTPFPHAEP